MTRRRKRAGMSPSSLPPVVLVCDEDRIGADFYRSFLGNETQSPLAGFTIIFGVRLEDFRSSAAEGAVDSTAVPYAIAISPSKHNYNRKH